MSKHRSIVCKAGYIELGTVGIIRVLVGPQRQENSPQTCGAIDWPFGRQLTKDKRSMTVECEWHRRRRLNRYASLVRPVKELTGKRNVPYPIGRITVAAGVDTEQDIRPGRVLGWLVGCEV